MLHYTCYTVLDTSPYFSCPVKSGRVTLTFTTSYYFIYCLSLLLLAKLSMMTALLSLSYQ